VTATVDDFSSEVNLEDAFRVIGHEEPLFIRVKPILRLTNASFQETLKLIFPMRDGINRGGRCRSSRGRRDNWRTRSPSSAAWVVKAADTS